MATTTAIALLLATLAAAAVGQIDNKQRLFQDLLQKQQYNPVVSPIGDTPLNVTVGLSLLYVTALSDSKVDVDAWVFLEWTDLRLRWDSEEYQLDNIRLPQDAIWTPDVVPYNNLDVRERSQEKFLAAVYNTGSVFVVNKATFRLPCQEDSGERACLIKFGSWVHDGLKINLLSRSEDLDLSDFVPEKHYSVTDATARREVVTYSCCPEPYPTVTFTFTLKEMRGWFD